jgi:hypothetical protein
MLYILCCDRRGVISTHKSLSSAIVALWIDQTVAEDDREDRSRIYEFKAGVSRPIGQREYLRAFRSPHRARKGKFANALKLSL